MRSVSRRAVLASPIALALGSGVASARSSSAIGFDLSTANPNIRFTPRDCSIVGIYDFDWLLTPEFGHMLDLIASSPGAIGGVRAFGIFTMGEREDLKPGTGGVVWSDPVAEPDFALPFEALDQLWGRGLTPFISLGFFPPAISNSPVAPPETYDGWKQLVRAFLQGLIDDDRFGIEAISTWSFEVWNEPNEGRFWTGSFEQYLDLYRATSEVVRDLGIDIRLGGPAMAYKPESEVEDGPGTMSRFLEFLRDDKTIQCDFISYHRKGTVDSSAPDPMRLRAAALEISGLVEQIVPDRAARLTLINNEADEKIGFEAPYLPRMDRFAASWLTTLVTTHAELSASRQPLSAVQDNANLQLIQAPFDGRRSIYSFLNVEERADLVKTSGAVWYDLLPMLEGSIVSAEPVTALFPVTSFHAVTTTSEFSLGFLATWHPTDGAADSSFSASITFENIPWSAITIAEWRIDATHSNAYAAALALGHSAEHSYSDADAVIIRGAQELVLAAPARRGVSVTNGQLTMELSLAEFDTVFYWITPASQASIEAPSAVTLRPYRAGIALSWQPVAHEQLLGYEVARDGEPIAGPIRPCSWIDSIATGTNVYAVRAVTASGIVSDWAPVEA